jgi:hypothetical protein
MRAIGSFQKRAVCAKACVPACRVEVKKQLRGLVVRS